MNAKQIVAMKDSPEKDAAMDAWLAARRKQRAWLLIGMCLAGIPGALYYTFIDGDHGVMPYVYHFMVIVGMPGFFLRKPL